MEWRKLRKKGNRLYHLAHYAKKRRIRKKNLHRLEKFKKKYNIPVGPIPKLLKASGSWNTGAFSGGFSITSTLENRPMLGAKIIVK